MQTSTLLRRNLICYWRTNLAVIFGIAVAVSVLAGALLVGDSVRASLRHLLLSRLGNTDQVITSTGFFREQLAADLQAHHQFAAVFNAACPLIVLEGVVTHDESRARASGVQVYGVDERFWKFHGQSEAEHSSGNEVLLSEALAQALGSKAGDAIVLRLEKPSDIPAESLQGRKDDTGRTMRFTAGKILSAAGIGEFSLRPQQGSVLALFVPLKRLQKDLEQEGKVNAILLSAKPAVNGVNAGQTEKMLRDTSSLADLGIRLRTIEPSAGHPQLVLEKESNLIDDPLAKLVSDAAHDSGHGTLPVFSYVVNTIRAGQREVPYSLVTATGPELFEGLRPDQKYSSAPIVLNEWTAKDLGAKIGDDVDLDYYVWQESGHLATKTAKFRLAQIVSINGPAADRDFVPEYPGITSSDSISDWDPPFPVDLKRIRPQDEAYWKQYRTTPKAFIPFEQGQELWKSRFGAMTSIRFLPIAGREIDEVRASLVNKLKEKIDPMRFGLSVISARAQGLEAARGATDFGEYFLYFSFFLVISALLLTGLFFKLGIEQRLREIGLLRATGFSATKIRSIFLGEGILLATIGSLLGLIGAFVYGWLMMYGLRTWWVGAVGTTLLKLHVSPLSLAVGFMGGVLTALGVIALTLRKLANASPRSLLAGEVVSDQWSVAGQEVGRNRLTSLFTASRLAVVFSVLGICLLLAATLKLIGQVPGFFGAGFVLLIAALFFWSAWLRHHKSQSIRGSGWWPVSLLGFRNTTSRPGRSVLCIALIASATFIIVAVDVFRRDAVDHALDKKAGNGGYSLLADSLLPLYHDPNTPEGRRELVLDATGDNTLAEVKFARFRVRPGDDTSCLNLYQPRNPKIIAPPDDFLKEGRFSFQGTTAIHAADQANPWLILNGELKSGAIPVIADANSMTYVLHQALGSRMIINDSRGQPVTLQFVAALSDSLFQSELIMSEKNFLRLFPDQPGWRLFLIDAAPQKAVAVTALLEDKLSDYGFDVMPTAERLASFHRVENTYLSTFQTLGGLGLLLGTVGLATVLLRNVLERRKELALLRAVGYNANHFAVMVLAENALLLLGGLATGMACAVLAVAPAFFARGGKMPGASLIWLLLAVLLTGLAASLLATVAAIRAPLLQELRAE